MGTTLYLLRQSPERISSSIFRVDDADMDIVLVERAASTIPALVKEYAVVDERIVDKHSHSTMTYDDLIEKIFSHERVIVV